ncbi:MAG: hypothetical protein KBT39_02900 [Bacteroidales bacterium]|nr:hypothetical protein [Bacteroidales bacterium]
MKKQYTNNHTTPFHFPPLGEVRWGFLFAILLLLASCREEAEIVSHTGDPNLELRSIDAVISTPATRATRASANNDYIGRDVFVAGDRMVLTRMQRTSKPLAGFSYAGVNYNYSGSAWDRNVDSDGMPTDEQPDRIYWSDNASPHTFIGYAIPQAWGTPSEVQTNGKWVNTENIYSGQFSYKTETTPEGEKKIVDFSAIDTEMEDILDADKQPTGQKIDKKGTKLKNEDLLLTHSTQMYADPGGLTTTLHYRHALASLRVIIDIQGFSPSAYAEDVKTTIDNLVVLNQPYKYTWHNAITDAAYTMTDGTIIPGWGVANSTRPEDGTVDIKTWQPRPQGEGSGQAKVFTFYSLIVPGKQTNFSIKYKVHYPKYLNPAEIQEKNYQAVLKDENGAPVTINFLPGYTTTIKVSLNHEGEPVYIGAEYIDWENVETPDRSDLQKISIFLDTDKRTDVTIATDTKATKDDATWLYKDGDKVVDIYGNDGSVTKPYLIKTARQLLSFAYEVQNGRTFNMQYVKLDSDIYLQKDLKAQDITWPGIGDETHPFEGFFLGGDRKILYLKGKPFFGSIGETAVVDKINFDKVLGVDGCGVVAHKNLGLICGCFIEGDVTAEPEAQYCGSIVGENQSFIIACAHVGKVTGTGTIGGLVGFNNGTIMACYHSGEVIGTGANPDVHATVGKRGDGNDGTNNSIMFSCYFDESLISHTPTLDASKSGFPLSTLMMQGNDFVNGKKDFVYDHNVYWMQSQTLKEVLWFLLYPEQEFDDSSSEQTLMNSLVAQGLTGRVNEVFAYHFSLNEAINAFTYWTNAIAETLKDKPLDATIQTNCHVFTKRQVLFLQQHYSNTAHRYLYTPATYPKVQ